GWKRQPTTITQTIDMTFPNFWRYQFRTTLTPRALSDELTRGGPLMGTPTVWNWLTSLANQTQATYSWSGSASYGKDELGGWDYLINGAITIRAAPRWQAQLSPQYSRSVDKRQYVSTLAGGPSATFGSRYLFGAIERSTLSAQIRLNYAFTPDL